MTELGGSLDWELSDRERDAIRTTMLRLLKRADVLGSLPTPLDQVMEVSKLVAAGDVSLDAEEQRRLRKRFGSLVDLVLDRLQGFVHFRSREIWVRPDLHVLRKRFVTAHEIGHDALPWQRDAAAYLDDNERLRPDVRLTYEREANQAAIELLAQGYALRKEADDSRLTPELLSLLSAKFQISLHATARRVVEETRQQAGLAIRFRSPSGHVGPYHFYSSVAFATRFAWSPSSMPTEAKVAAREAATGFGVSTFHATDLASRFAEVRAETIDTPRALLVLFSPTSRPRAVRRLLRVG